VLGAGGPVGHAFHAGVLRALVDGCGWDARRADLVLGTSAGAIAGALLRAGTDARELYSAASGDPRSPLARLFARPSHRRPPVERARRWPASPAYLWRMLRRPWHLRPGRLASALLPEGMFDNLPLGEVIDRLHPERWPERPLWITAVSLDTGARVAFGQPGAPPVDVGTAVRCSSAVPWLRRPVRLGEHRFVDGGIASPTHLDLLSGVEGGPPRLVIVSSPLSRFPPLRLLLRIELRRLSRHGARIVVFEPDGEVAAAMGWNPMDARLTPAVAAAAYRAVCRGLEGRAAADLRDLLLDTA
jgi:NTE family protein